MIWERRNVFLTLEEKGKRDSFLNGAFYVDLRGKI